LQLLRAILARCQGLSKNLFIPTFAVPFSAGIFADCGGTSPKIGELRTCRPGNRLFFGCCGFRKPAKWVGRKEVFGLLKLMMTATPRPSCCQLSVKLSAVNQANHDLPGRLARTGFNPPQFGGGVWRQEDA